jgi:hypothetical protein
VFPGTRNDQYQTRSDKRRFRLAAKQDGMILPLLVAVVFACLLFLSSLCFLAARPSPPLDDSEAPSNGADGEHLELRVE